MFTRIGFVPMAPLLDPNVASGAAGELDALRQGLRATVASVAEESELVVLLPHSAHAIMRWLLEDAGLPKPAHLIAVADSPSTQDPIATDFMELAHSRDQYGLLVFGDGSACRSVKAPGYLDERAAGFDEVVGTALRNGDAKTLRDLDIKLAAELLVAGRATWPILGRAVDDQQWTCEFFDMQDPYGVAYFVALWRNVGIGNATT